ncbi:MAG: porin family protein [Bacteroidaceae bacterium]|nr:porin family protein [Bacteroidaceae bacterium]
MKKLFLIAAIAIMSVAANAQDKGPKTGFRLGIEAGYTFATEGKGSWNDVNIDITAGAQILPWFYVGGGIGLDIYTDSDLKTVMGGTPLQLPIYGQVKFFLPTRSVVQPYIDLRGGYAVNLSKSDDGGIVECGIGAEFFEHWNLSVGYNGRFYSKSKTVGQITQTTSWDTNGVYLRLGYRF